MTISNVGGGNRPYSYLNVLDPNAAPAGAAKADKEVKAAADVNTQAKNQSSKGVQLSPQVLQFLQEFEPDYSDKSLDLFGGEISDNPLDSLVGKSDKGTVAQVYSNLVGAAIRAADSGVEKNTDRLAKIIGAYQTTQSIGDELSDADFKAFLDANTRGADGKLLDF